MCDLGKARWDTLEGFVFLWISQSLCNGLFLFSVFGLIWAVVAPNWVDRLFQRAARNLILVLFVFCLLSLPYVLWALFRA